MKCNAKGMQCCHLNFGDVFSGVTHRTSLFCDDTMDESVFGICLENGTCMTALGQVQSLVEGDYGVGLFLRV